MISADIKTDAKQEMKELVTASYNFSQKYLLKTIFHLILVGIPSSLILSVKDRVGGRRGGGVKCFYLMTKIS